MEEVAVIEDVKIESLGLGIQNKTSRTRVLVVKLCWVSKSRWVSECHHIALTLLLGWLQVCNTEYSEKEYRS